MSLASLLRYNRIEDLYRAEEDEDYKRGLRAFNFYNHLADCLEVELQMRVLGKYQWTEERSPNHNRYMMTPKWPVGLIQIDPIVPASRCRELENRDGFDELNLKIISVSNSKGGNLNDKSGEYKFTKKGRDLGTYEDAEKSMIEKYRKEPDFGLVDNQVIDYITLRGLDKISQGKILIVMGNPPRFKKRYFNKSKNPMPPAKSIELPLIE